MDAKLQMWSQALGCTVLEEEVIETGERGHVKRAHRLATFAPRARRDVLKIRTGRLAYHGCLNHLTVPESGEGRG